MDIAGELQRHPLFSTFTPDALAEVAGAGSAVAYQPGDVCVRAGEAGEVFGVLISGRLEVFRGAGTGRSRVGTIEAGECFGEMSLLTGNPSSADVVALEQSEAIVFMEEAIGPVIATNSEAVRFLARLMTSRLAPGPGREAPPRPRAARYSLGAATPMQVLAVSCRKDDLRYSYFDTTAERPRAGGAVTGLGGPHAVHTWWGPQGRGQATIAPLTSGAPPHEPALADVLRRLGADAGGPLDSPEDLSVIGHRVCHGGLEYDAPALVDDAVKQEIARLANLAPMENPFNLSGIEACETLAPSVPQVAVFDTAFHLSMPPSAYRYALPADLATEPQLRRFGSHGISHEGAARAACAHLGANFDALEVVSCHLGSGASITAIDHGRPIDNSMGLTPLDGLVMSTRCGELDPGLVLHLICDRGISPELLRERLYTESGLLGLSGISDDVQTVLAAADSGEPRALLAVEVYCRRARKYLSSYAALLRGADAIVFTGGVGQNQPGIRARICQDLDCLGIKLDEMRNRTARVDLPTCGRQAGAGQVAEISAAQSAARVLVVGSDEEHTIARHAVRAVAHKRITEVIRKQSKPIPVNPSAHHVHLAPEHVAALFGPGHELTWHADLSQPGQFACRERVGLLGPKGRIDRVRVIGPTRAESQVEISRTEEFKLGIDAPIRVSGDLVGTPGITLEGTAGQVTLKQGLICAMRHVHMTPQDAMEFAVRDHDVVRIRAGGRRSLTFGDVVVRVDPAYRLDMHIDTDEANAGELSADAVGYLDSVQQRA